MAFQQLSFLPYKK